MWLIHQNEGWLTLRSSRCSSRCSRSVPVQPRPCSRPITLTRLFISLLQRPDADHKIAFLYFDVDGSNSIDFEEFKAVFSSNIGPDAIPFNFDSDWVKLYIGKKNVIGYVEFTQVRNTLSLFSLATRADQDLSLVASR